jgi:hypothetical protein
MADEMSIDDIKAAAAELAMALQAAGGADGPVSGTGGGSRHRGLPEDLRARFVALRAALFQRGVFDPMLVRFDTASAAQASNGEIAEELRKLAASL